MSEENVGLVRKMYETTTGKLDPDFHVLARDVEFHLSGVFPDLDPVYRGHEGIRRLNDRLNAPWDEISLVPEKFVDRGDRILVLCHFDARGRDGIEASLAFAHVWTVRNGQVMRLDAYSDQQKALEAVGLSRSWREGDQGRSRPAEVDSEDRPASCS